MEVESGDEGDYEARFAGIESEFLQAEARVDAAEERAEALAKENEELKKAAAAHREQVQKLQSSLSAATSRLDGSNRLASSRLSAVEVAEQLAARRLAENDRLKAELQESERRFVVQAQRTSAASRELEELRSGELPGKLELSRLRVEVELKAKHAEWLRGRMDEQNEALLQERRQRHAETADLQSQIYALTSEKEELESTIESLKRQVGASEATAAMLTARMESEQERREDMETSAQSAEAAHGKLKAAYERSTRELQAQLAEQKSMCEELERAYRAAREKYDEKLEDVQASAQRAMEEAQHKAEVRIKELNEKLKQDPLKHLVEMSDSAAAAELQKRGVSATALYGNLMETRAARVAAEEEVERLKTYLDRILREIEAKAPAVAAQRQEFERALKSHDELNDRLVVAMKEISALKMSLQRSEESRVHAEEKCVRLENDARDLAKQVKTLLMPEADVTSPAKSNDSVTFRTVGELQEKNIELLRIVRELKEKENLRGNESNARTLLKISSSSKSSLRRCARCAKAAGADGRYDCSAERYVPHSSRAGR